MTGARARAVDSVKTRPALEAGAEGLLDTVLELAGIARGGALEVTPALGVVPELEVTGRQRLVRNDVEKPDIVGKRVVVVAGLAAPTQAVEHGDGLREAACPHQLPSV